MNFDFPLAAMGWLQNTLFVVSMILYIFVCVIMTLLVLIQKGRGGGLAGAFGGAGGNTAFGAKTGDVLTWATSIVFGVFLLLAVTLNLLSDTSSGRAAASTPVKVAPLSTGQNSPVPSGSPRPSNGSAPGVPTPSGTSVPVPTTPAAATPIAPAVPAPAPSPAAPPNPASPFPALPATQP